MKITKRQLRRIIKEEKQKLIAEANLNDLRRMRVDIDDVLAKHGVTDAVQAAAMLRMLADKLEKDGLYSSGEPKFIDMTDPREL